MRVGFIGYGEAAYEMSNGLYQEGLQEIVAFDPMWDHPKFKSFIRERAKQASVTLLPTMKDVVECSTIIIVAVPADKAYDVSQSVYPFLNKNTLYVDVSASAPEIKVKIGELIEEKECAFVDAAMMGSLTAYKHQVPILASGKGTDDFIKWMSAYHMNIEKVSGTSGDASATKLIRSIFMKGISVLLIEMLEAAHHFQVEDLVTESIFETMDDKPFKEIMNRLVTATSIHSKRRSAELQGALDMLKNSNLNGVMTKASKEKLDIISSQNLNEEFGGRNPSSWQEVIKALHN